MQRHGFLGRCDRVRVPPDVAAEGAEAVQRAREVSQVGPDPYWSVSEVLLGRSGRV